MISKPTYDLLPVLLLYSTAFWGMLQLYPRYKQNSGGLHDVAQGLWERNQEMLIIMPYSNLKFWDKVNKVHLEQRFVWD